MDICFIKYYGSIYSCGFNSYDNLGLVDTTTYYIQYLKDFHIDILIQIEILSLSVFLPYLKTIT